MPCSLDSCSSWCRQKYGRIVGAIGFGCQIFGGVETLAFCECSDGGRPDADLTRAVLCHELVACSACDNGYCSTSPVKNKYFNNLCVACKPGFELLPTGICAAVIGALEAESIYRCPLKDPCGVKGGKCVDGDTFLKTPFFCECKPGFEGPLCDAVTYTMPFFRSLILMWAEQLCYFYNGGRQRRDSAL